MRDPGFAWPSIRVERLRLLRIADALAAAVAASLPWSTSASGILIACWIVALLPTLEPPAIRRKLAIPAGLLPILLVALAALGMLWTDVSFAARLNGLTSFLKLLAIPLLMVQFRHSDGGGRVLWAFLLSAGILCLLSWLNVAVPTLPWTPKMPGILVKDYISQSGIFTLCIFGLVYVAADIWRKEHARSLALFAAALVFLANIIYVATGRTAVVVIPVLFVLFGLRRLTWLWFAAFLLVGALLAALAWTSSSYLRERVGHVAVEVQQYRTEHADTSSGERLDFWKRSLKSIRAAPVLGHGTGSIRETLHEIAAGQPELGGIATNPHNQTFAVAVQLGLVGVVALFAMWIAHWRMFAVSGLTAWLGMIVVAQNVVSSLFNSHLFDFTQGWTYVFGVGVLGGMLARERSAEFDRPTRDPDIAG